MLALALGVGNQPKKLFENLLNVGFDPIIMNRMGNSFVARHFCVVGGQ